MKRLIVLFLLFTLNILYAAGQLKTERKNKELVQLTGRLLDELLQPLPYAHILVLNNYRGTITDKEGKFSFVTEENDSIMFSSLGYKRQIIIIPDNLKEPFLTMDIVLETDTFMIGEVEIYPWKSYEEFKKAFLNLQLPDDDMDRARKNIALLKTQIILDETPSARANFKQILEQQYRDTYTQGTYPSYQIFNAFAWAEFFKALRRGDFNKYSKPED
ncbi:MAG: carboxypeptidase-like regulatory domain-containing protein [Bacteroidales bacterium]|nr:carboxypeptidase-like regulatory domain-containing protein [Bacteroidales bacterium]